MMAVRYHGCTCHQRYSAQQQSNGNGATYGAATQSKDNNRYNKSNIEIVTNDNICSIYRNELSKSDEEDEDGKQEEPKPQPWYFHVVASLILVVHGLTFLVPQDSDVEDTDMVRTVAKWFGYELDWVKHFTPYAQVWKKP